MTYNRDYFGYVYLWYDTKHKKYIIGSHHGDVDDSYKTSTGGKHVRNIFRARPETMKMKVLEYNTLSNNSRYTKHLEQKWLDYRPNITENNRYYNKRQTAEGFDSDSVRVYIAQKVADGTFHLLGGKIQRESNLRQVAAGTHLFQQPSHRKRVSDIAKLKVAQGSHVFCQCNFNKIPFIIKCSDGREWVFESKADAVRYGMKAHLIDAVKAHGSCTIQKWSRGKISFKKGDIITYTELINPINKKQKLRI